MTNEELDHARVDEAIRTGNGIVGTVALIAARLAREGWTPPKPVDSDIARAQHIWDTSHNTRYTLSLAASAVFEGIKQGRALASEVKPGMVWKEHDGSEKSPVSASTLVLLKYAPEMALDYTSGEAAHRQWANVTHYAIITQPDGAA